MAPTSGNGKKLVSWVPIILASVGMLLAGGVGYGALSSEVRSHDQQIKRMENCVNKELPLIRERLTRIETLLTKDN